MASEGSWLERTLLGAPLYCSTCGTVGHSKRVRRGNFFGEVLLWTIPTIGLFLFWPLGFFYVAALIYSVSRLFARRPICGACRSEAVIPLTAPKAIEGLKRRPQ